MCGIIGYIGNNDCKKILIDSLKKLEYRGYDSCGVSLVYKNTLKTIKCAGRIIDLENKLEMEKDISSNIGVGHTRWATHGACNDINAHPHKGETCVLVHNGIIENYKELKNKLINKNHSFYSDVDSEVIAKLLDEYKGENNLDTLIKVCNKLEGSFALNVIFNNELDKIYVAKKASPLIIGLNKKKKYITCNIAFNYFGNDSNYCRT